MEKEVFNNINYSNKTISVPMPSKINDIDTNNSLYNNVVESSDNHTLDLNSINSFTSISRSRDEVYRLLDTMSDDPIISSALEIYASDACEPNDYGRVVWAEADDSNVLGEVERLLDAINIDKNAYGWVYSLCKYGDLYLRAYRKSDYDRVDSHKRKPTNGSLNEDVNLRVYSKNDRYAEYLEAVKNPAEMFNLYKLGKSYGYLKTNIVTHDINGNDIAPYLKNQYLYNFKKEDVDIYPATEFVHASLDDNSSRVSEEVTISSDEESYESKYSIKRGQSVLYNSFKIWRELSLLENSVLLNRITKSSIVRTVSVEVGDMEKNDVRNLLNRIKGLIEQKSAINSGKSLQEYTNPGPMENIIYVPTHGGIGAITTAQVGGDVNVGDLTDLGYWKKKLFASLGIPGQYLGDTDDATGFNGGTSLSLISSRYAKTIKRIQNTFVQAITDYINLVLLDKGLYDYIGQFTIRMQAPTTQEEKDRKENLSSTINNVREIMSLLDGIETPQTKLEILKSLLSNAVNNSTVISAIQEEIDRLTEEAAATSGDNVSDDLGGEDSESLDDLLGGEDLPTAEETGSTPIDFSDVEMPAEESLPSKDGELLMEEDDLPSFEDLGISYDSVV